MNYNNWYKLLVSIIICEFAGIIGSAFTMPAINSWYRDLNKPFFNPPNWVFGPVWTIIFVLMGVSLYLVWNIGKKTVKAKKIFALQWVLNIFWTVIFFKFHSLLFAFIEILFLCVAIFWTIIEFYKVSRAAAYLLLPYIVWVSFAAVLNLSILILN